MGKVDANETIDEVTKPQAFPPTYDDEMNSTQAFPPQQSVNEPVHQFPPMQQSAFPQQAAFIAPQTVYGQPSPVGNNYHVGNPTMMMQGQVAANQPWRSSLFDCMNDPQNAIITACFPCITFGQIAEIVDAGSTSCGNSGLMYGCIAFLIAMPCLISCGYRTKMRNKFGLIESPAPDWIVHCFCEWCALCQEYRELQARGIDPAIGWIGNVAKQQQQQQQIGMTPPMHQRMM